MLCIFFISYSHLYYGWFTTPLVPGSLALPQEYLVRQEYSYSIVRFLAYKSVDYIQNIMEEHKELTLPQI
jgi:hypothetical protein